MCPHLVCRTAAEFTFNFEKLDVWQKAIQFADLVSKIAQD